MKKILTLALPLLFLSLITIQANAVVTPVEVERVKDFYSIRVRGDHRTLAFLFHYVNLSPNYQMVGYRLRLYNEDGVEVALPSVPMTVHVSSGCSWDYSYAGGGIGYGYTMFFELCINNEQITEGWVVIPPPP